MRCHPEPVRISPSIAMMAEDAPSDSPISPIRLAWRPCADWSQSQAPRTSRYSSEPQPDRPSSMSESPWSRRSIMSTEKPLRASIPAGRRTTGSWRQLFLPWTTMTAGAPAFSAGTHEARIVSLGWRASRLGKLTSW